LDNGERPVVMLVNTAWRMMRGTELGRALEEIQAEIERSYDVEPPLVDLPDRPEVLIFGGEGEWVDDAFMEQAQTAGRQVARLLVPRFVDGQRQSGVGLGTGWLVAPRLMLTNHHVVNARDLKEPDAADADFRKQGENTVAWFDYHREGEPAPTVAAIALVASNRALDYALLRLADSTELLQPRGRMALALKTGSLPQGARLNIVQYPGGGPLRYAIRNNFFVGLGEKHHQVRYLTDTIAGSSGSPVLNDSWQVVAMHRGAREVDPNTYNIEGGKTEVIKYHNEGIAIHEILSCLPSELRKEIEAAQAWT
jgi:V8-like Glu-specific endopeptidase